MKPKYWNKGKNYLSNKDKVLKKIIDQFPNQSLKLNDNSFHALINSIIGQQISVSAANSMKIKLFSLKNNITPRSLKNLKNNQLKKCGLSKQKILYINNVSEFFINISLMEDLSGPMTKAHLSFRSISVNLILDFINEL